MWAISGHKDKTYVQDKDKCGLFQDIDVQLKFSFSVVMATNQDQQLCKSHKVGIDFSRSNAVKLLSKCLQ